MPLISPFSGADSRGGGARGPGLNIGDEYVDAYTSKGELIMKVEMGVQTNLSGSVIAIKGPQARGPKTTKDPDPIPSTKQGLQQTASAHENAKRGSPTREKQSNEKEKTFGGRGEEGGISEVNKGEVPDFDSRTQLQTSTSEGAENGEGGGPLAAAAAAERDAEEDAEGDAEEKAERERSDRALAHWALVRSKVYDEGVVDLKRCRAMIAGFKAVIKVSQ
jgi:hypothetical protein